MIPRMMEVEKVVWGANALKTRELPKTVLRSLLMRLVVTHTNGAAPVLTAEDLAGLITKVNIVLNGQDTIWSIPFKFLMFMNMLDYSVLPRQSLDTTASTADLTSYIDIRLPIYLTRAAIPEDTLLDVRQAPSIIIEVQWAAASLGTDVTVTAADLVLFTDEYAQVARQNPFARHEVGYFQANLDATGKKLIDLEYGGNNQYKRLMIFTYNNTPALADSQIDEIAVRSRSFYYAKVSDQILRAKNEVDYSYDIPAGVFFLDFMRDGKASTRLDARALNELKLEVNSLVSNGTIWVVKEKAIYA